MSMSLTEDFKTVDDLRDDPAGILAQLRKNSRPISITQKGKPAAVLLEVRHYEWLVHLLNFCRLVNKGEEDIRAGRVQPLEDFLKELDSETKSSGANHRKRHSRRPVHQGANRTR